MNCKLRILLNCLMLCLIASCSSSKEVTYRCKEKVTAKDMRGLDGCGWFFITETGRKLMPMNTPPGMDLADGAAYMIDYKELQGMASICMAEDAQIQVNCLEAVKTGTAAADAKCTDVLTPEDTPWMMSIIHKNDIRILEKMTIDKHIVYQFRNKKIALLYDCKQNLLCTDNKGDETKCLENRKVSGLKTIWVLNY